MNEELLSRLAEDRLGDVPEVGLERDLTRISEGDLVVFPRSPGPTVTLRFPAPYEPFLRVDGKRLLEANTSAERVLLIWLGRRLPALSRILEERTGLRAVLHKDVVRVSELVELESENLLDHSAMRRLSEADVTLPAFAVLGPMGSRAELMSRLRSIYAAGTQVEVRGEEMGRTLWRGHLEVGR